MDFSETQIRRYARHIILKEIGGTGQAALIGARVLVIGAGGLGSPALLYLAAAGVGTLGIVDDDEVDLTNLQRQIIHRTRDVGRPKVESAVDAIHAVNPDVTVRPHDARLGPENALDLVAGYDVVIDGSDNFGTRYVLNDACYLARRPLVTASILRFEAQIATFRAYDRGENGAPLPCYRCIFPEAPPPGTVPSCAEGGVLGALAGTVGAFQATEAIKEILGIGQSLAGYYVLYDALAAEWRKIRAPADPDCVLCSDRATFRDLSHHLALS